MNFLLGSLRCGLILCLIGLAPASAKKRLTLTCRRNDGGGAQIHGRMSVFAFCKFFRIGWKHSAIEGAHFSSGDDWDSKWNDLFDFALWDSEVSVGPNTSRKVISLDSALKVAGFLICLVLFRRTSFYLGVMQSAHDFTNFYPRALEECMNLFRRSFKPTLDSPMGGVVFHVRRGGDITAPVRFESNETIEGRLRSICERYPEKQVTIYSNDKLGIDVGKFSRNVRVDYTSSPFVAMSHMVNSEILVIAKSSMSYSAALASGAITFCPNFWHPKMSSWLAAESLDGESNCPKE